MLQLYLVPRPQCVPVPIDPGNNKTSIPYKLIICSITCYTQQQFYNNTDTTTGNMVTENSLRF